MNAHGLTGYTPVTSHLRVLVSGTSSDSHTWNLILLQLALQEQDREVLNLGPCVPDELLAETCLGWKPEVLILSSVNGHGHSDAARAIATLRRDLRLNQLPVVVGGLLGTTGCPNADYAPHLYAAGANAVFEADELPALQRFLSRLANRRDHKLKVAS